MGNMSLEKQVAMPEQFKDIVIGVVGTGMMATAHALHAARCYPGTRYRTVTLLAVDTLQRAGAWTTVDRNATHAT